MKEYEQLLLDIRRKIFKPVYFLHGEEPYFIDALSDAIEQNALEEQDREFNQAILYGKDVSLPAVISMAREFPMMSDRRVVIVREAQNIAALARKTGEEGEGEGAKTLQQLAAYVAKPQESTVLVFCYKYKTLDKRTSLAKALAKHAVLFESKKLYDNQLPDWITGYMRERSRAISSRAAFLLSEYVGNDLSRLAGELDKLVMVLKQGEEITPELIQEKVGIHKEYNVFELQDALGKRDILKANRIVQYFGQNEKEHPMPLLLGSLYGYFAKILRYHGLREPSKFEAASALGVKPFFVDGYAAAARNFPVAKLSQVLAAMKEMDLKSKGVNNPGTPGGELLKEFVFKVLH